MRTRKVTPVWVKLALALALAGGPAWWLVQHQDRIGNERRMAAIASEIAGRDVQVRCPGVMGRIFAFDTVEGSVQFDANGRPADETRLRVFTCTELDALAEGRRSGALACAEREETGCAGDLAMAVDVLVHESWHLAGVLDEAQTECRAVQSIAWAAERLGATPAEAQGLARVHLAHGYPRLPERYRSGECADGRAMDLRPGDPIWP
jgi:hypothetical protein